MATPQSAIYSQIWNVVSLLHAMNTHGKAFCNNTLKTEHFLESSKADFLLLLLSAIQDDTRWQTLRCAKSNKNI